MGYVLSGLANKQIVMLVTVMENVLVVLITIILLMVYVMLAQVEQQIVILVMLKDNIKLVQLIII